VRIKQPPRIVTLQEPPSDDKDFALYVKSQLQRGGYIVASERQRIAEIAKTYPAWIRQQQLPTESGTGPWKKAQQYFRAGKAKER
jgi:hypothetical protein